MALMTGSMYEETGADTAKTADAEVLPSNADVAKHAVVEQSKLMDLPEVRVARDPGFE